jgi:3-deoxy-manno-octulosonate cytidylyltransferase (CMP-KDO synthetase)
MGATRLPGKPLADLLGKPLILHVIDRAREADIGPIVVACGEEEIAEVVMGYGAHAVLTNPSLPSGSDRIYEALVKYDLDGQYKYIVNLQGDLPNIDPEILKSTLNMLRTSKADVATPVCPITDENLILSPNTAKAVFSEITNEALYFSRSPIPYRSEIYYYHLGVYAYKREALERFVSLPPSKLEIIEKLEQLRALENGMKITVSIVDTIPLSVDTPEDLARAMRIMGSKNSIR